MFDWIGDALSWVGDKFSDVGTAISEAVWDVMLEWLFNTIYGAVAEFFGMMNGMGADIFSQSWVSAFLQLFSLFGWTLFAAGLVVAVFDTAFHQSIPKERYIYPIPYEYYKKYGIRKYGAHGTSHEYVAHRVAEIMEKDIKDLKIVNCHLGQGASVCAIQNGKSVETSMGLTPLGGIPMGTRSGDLDPSVVTYLMKKENLTPQEMEDILNKKSGVYGMSRGVSVDFRDIENEALAGGTHAQMALDIYHYLTASYVAKCAVAMGGIDVLTFTAGVGEKGPISRKAICDQLEFFGVKIDDEKNKIRGEEVEISAEDSKVKVYVVPTNEELMIARDTVALVK